MALNLIMLGPPGAGKGTQAERVARARGVPRISTGDILREAVQGRTEIGLKVTATMDRGELVSDDVMIGVVADRLSQQDALCGFVLDGFPRTVAQAAALDGIMKGRGPLVVVDIVVPEAELVRRLGSRMICADCGTNAGQSSGTALDPVLVPTGPGLAAQEPAAAVLVEAGPDRCRRCGGQLVQRSDDSDLVVLERLKVYHAQTEPLVEYYSRRPTFRSVNGAQAPDRVTADLAAAIEAASRIDEQARGGVRQ